MTHSTLLENGRRLTQSVMATLAALVVLTSTLAAQFEDFPPTLVINPGSGVVTSANLSFTVDWCDDHGLDPNSEWVKLNGITVSTSGTTSSEFCFSKWRTTGTVTLALGLNTLEARICDFSLQCVTDYQHYTYTNVAVTPDNFGVTQPQRTSGLTKRFLVHNIGGTSGTFNLTAVCSGSVSGCSTQSSITLGGGASDSVTVTYQTDAAGSGTVKLRAELSTAPASKDSGYVNVTVQSSLLAYSYTYNDDNQKMGLCATACFAVTHAQGTVPYVSLNQPRSVALVYHGDRVAVRPVVHADVSLFTGATAPTEYWFQVKDSLTGAFFPFVNGDATKHVFSGGSGQPVRLAGQIDASAYATSVRPIQIIVTAVRDAAGSQPAFNEEVTLNAKLLVVNDRTSPIARGWTVAGLQRLYPQSGRGVLLTEGDGSAVFFTGNCSAPCTYTAPSGEFTQLRTLSSGGIVTYLREYPDSTKAWFRSAGLLDSIADSFGNATRFEYDGSSRLTKVYDPVRTYSGGASRSYIALTYGTYGLSQIKEPGPDGSPTGGRVTGFTVESDSTLRAIIDPDNDSTRFVYDASRRLEKVVSRRGTDTTQYAYGTQSWKLVKTILPRIAIDAGGGSTVDSTPVITYQPWQTVGVPTAATSSAARATPPKQDSILAKVTDPAGRTTSMTVDRWGQPLKVTDPLGRVTTIERVGLFPQAITHPTGAVDRLLYAAHQLQWTKPAGQDTTYFQYGAYDRVIKIWGPARATQHFKTGVNGRVDSVRVGTSNYTTHYRYDTRGRVTTVIDPGADTVKYHYDDTFGNLDSTLAPGSRYTRIRFDGYGRDSTVRSAGSPTVTTLYDVLNRVKEVRDSTSASPTTYTYDKIFLTRVQDPKNQVYRFDVNRLGWKTREYDPADTLNRFVSYRYNPAGLLTSTTNRRGQRVDLTYDAVNRLISKRGPANVVADSFAYAIGTFGERMLAYNAVSRDSVFTSPLGWVDSVVTRLATDSTKRFRIRYRPDAMQRLDSIGLESVGAISFPMRRFYWNSGSELLDSLRVGDKLVTFGRGDEGQRTTTTWEGSLTRTETHTRLHQGSTVSYNNTTIDAALWRGYGYDSLARLSEVDRKNGSGYKVRLFGYTGVGQLRRVEDASLASGTSGCPGTQAMDDYGNACIGESGLSSEQVILHAYDHVGNLTQEENVTTSTTTQATLTTGNRVTQWGTTPYVYDLDGNVSRKRSGSDSVRYHWSADGRLDSVTTSGLRAHYEYNALGQLVRKRRNGTADRHFLWDQGHLLAELDGTLAARVAEYAYYPGTDRPLALLTGSTTVNNTRYVQQDELGSVVGVTTLTAVSQELHYDAWGKVTSTTGTLGDTARLRWKALPWESDSTQLYYVRNRWYDPITKRFVSEDPIGLAGGINPYVYGSNDPVNRFDPLGLSDCVAVNVVIVDVIDGKIVETPTRMTICGGESTIGQILDYAARHGVGNGSAHWGGGVFATSAALAHGSAASGDRQYKFFWWIPELRHCPPAFADTRDSYMGFVTISVRWAPGSEKGWTRVYTGTLYRLDYFPPKEYAVSATIICRIGAGEFRAAPK